MPPPPRESRNGGATSTRSARSNISAWEIPPVVFNGDENQVLRTLRRAGFLEPEIIRADEAGTEIRLHLRMAPQDSEDAQSQQQQQLAELAASILAAASAESTTSNSRRNVPVSTSAKEKLDISWVQYSQELETTYLDAIRKLISKDLSEPYSIYVYRYFLYQWGDLCFMALDRAKNLLGVVVSKLEVHRGGPLRGYIAMLATQEQYRNKGIATRLVRMAIDAMAKRGADEIALETEVTNTASLKLYERLGFLRSKRLHRYYLNGNEAFRLLLYLKEGVSHIPTYPPDYPPPPDEYGEPDQSLARYHQQDTMDGGMI